MIIWNYDWIQWDEEHYKRDYTKNPTRIKNVNEEL
jgi:hypothetical protein